MVGVTVHGVKALVTPTNMLTAANTTKPGCPRKCGNLTVPYPFGIGIDCSFDHSFSIICNTSNDPPKAFSVIPLGSSENPEILNITESQVMIWNSQIASKCYDDDGNVVSETGKNFKMLDLRFRYALTNKLRVVGCNDYAVIASYNGRQYSYKAGCIALCSSPDSVIEGSCLGLGCCQKRLTIICCYSFKLAESQFWLEVIYAALWICLFWCS